jgi:hypothetical protein
MWVKRSIIYIIGLVLLLFVGMAFARAESPSAMAAKQAQAIRPLAIRSSTMRRR